MIKRIGFTLDAMVFLCQFIGRFCIYIGVLKAERCVNEVHNLLAAATAALTETRLIGNDVSVRRIKW